MPDKDDDKIRMRCTGCGKRVKFPKESAGQTFRCPKCHKVMVAPLDGKDGEAPSQAELKSVARPSPKLTARPRHAATQAVRRAGLGQNRQEEATTNLLNSIERVNGFLNRQTQTIGPMCRRTLMDTGLSKDGRIVELRRLRSVKAVNLKKFVDGIVQDLDKAIEELKVNPAVETDTIKEKLQQLVTERECLTQYVQVMFALRSVAEEMPATPGTPACEAAPPNSASLQAPQNQQDTGADAPKPADKAPDSN